MTTTALRQPLAMTADQREALQHFSTLLSRRTGSLARVVVTDAAGGQDELSGQEARELAAALDTALRAFTSDEPIEIIAVGADVTTTQAARLLGMSRQYLVRLLDRGAIPFHMTGTHRRINVSDLLAYKQRLREGVQRLARLSEDLGLYE
jgi:excisionase family DNA binding protein